LEINEREWYGPTNNPFSNWKCGASGLIGGCSSFFEFKEDS